MTELAIDLAGPLYKNLRATGLAPPDELVLASVRAPTSTERAHVDVDVTLLRTTIDGRDVLVGTVIQTREVSEVLISVLMPRYLERATPMDTLEFFAMRFGVIFAINGTVHKFTRASEGAHGTGTSPVIEPLEDGTSAFLLFAPVQETATTWTLPLAFGIDLDQYARWRRSFAPPTHGGTTLTIHPGARSIIQEPVLVDPRASFMLVWEGSAQAAPDLEFFRVSGDGFALAAGIHDGQLFLQRNGDRVAAAFPAHVEGDEVALLWAWTPQQLRVATLSQLAGTAPVWQTLATASTFAPRPLVAWARHDRIRPAFLYEDVAHVHRTVLELLVGVADKIQFAGLAPAFWNTPEGGPPAPKREADVRPIVDGLLFEACTGKDLQVAAAEGALAFVITGTLLDGTPVPVCVAFANAHAPDLTAGATTRLPALMKAHASTLGVHGVLAHGLSAAPSADALHATLEAAAAGRDVTVQVWDVSVRARA